MVVEVVQMLATAVPQTLRERTLLTVVLEVVRAEILRVQEVLLLVAQLIQQELPVQPAHRQMVEQVVQEQTVEQVVRVILQLMVRVVVQELRLVVEVVVVRKMQVEPEIQVELVELDRLNFRGNLPLSGEFLT